MATTKIAVAPMKVPQFSEAVGDFEIVEPAILDVDGLLIGTSYGVRS